MIFRRRSDLPVEGDSTSRFLPWLIAPMVFLCAVALAGAFIVHGLIGRWDRDVSGTLTVEIAAAPGAAAESTEVTHSRVEQAVRLLSETPGIANARALSQEELVELLVPWLGNGDLLKELPLPGLIDVTLQPGAAIDLDTLGKSLTDAIPGASLDDHRVWLAKLIDLSRSIEWLAIGIVVLISAVTAATVFYATRAGMAVHHEVIEVLHLIGAADDYVARQFADRAFALGLRGGLVGLALTLPVLGAIGLGAHRLQGGFLADLSLPLTGWLGVLLLPAAAALLSMVTARIAVYQTLARML